MRDHHLVDYELQVLLAVAGKRPPMRGGPRYGQAMEALAIFGYIQPDARGTYALTPEGVEIAESVKS